MPRYRFLISIILTVVTFVFALSFYWRPLVKNDYADDKFSAQKVAGDIKIISLEPHSIEHPQERKKVRDYLAKRLDDMEISASYYNYDSIISRLNTIIQISNIYAKVDPLSGDAPSYLLLTAHMDSRFRKRVIDKYVYSYGAADDGYGMGVILESVRLALRFRENWKQGIKILFTDSEESDLDGIRNALEKNPEIFDKVGFVINIEARGVKGPALLFETSSGNENIIELYKSAEYPFTYSLTTAVYNILPNSTDFTLLKNSYPGMNFSVIDNLKFYHTDLDNYSNISMNSVQHYGEQITPIINKYLTDKTYSDRRSLYSENDSIFLTMPLAGLVIFSKNLYLMINIFTLVLLCVVTWLLIKKKKIRKQGVLKYSVLILLYSVIASLTGFCIAFISAVLTKQRYSIVNLPYVEYDWVIITVSLTALILFFGKVYLNKIQKSRFNPAESIIGNAIVQILISIFLYLSFGENFFVLLPALLALFALLLSVLTHSRYLYIIAYVLILLLLVPFYYAIIVALTIGSLPIYMILATLLISLLMPLMDSFVRKLV